MIKKILKIALLVILIGFLVIQFFRPERFTTAEVSPEHITKITNVPPDVEKILRRSCFDCHSNHTVWPWYSNIAPVSWLVSDDVVKGRKKMNFSEWGKLTESKREKKFQDICDEITDGEMPLKNYLLIHSDAVLTQADKDAICKWTEQELNKMGSSNENGEDKK
jgi:hypothetical protein